MDLPSPILNEILVKLPVEELLKTAAVCRDFEERIWRNKDGFLDIFPKQHTAGWILGVSGAELRVFDTGTRSWLRIKLKLPPSVANSLTWAGEGFFGMESKGAVRVCRLGASRWAEIHLEQALGRKLCRAFLAAFPCPTMIQFVAAKDEIRTSIYETSAKQWTIKASLSKFRALTNVFFSPTTSTAHCLSYFHDGLNEEHTKYTLTDDTFADLARYVGMELLILRSTSCWFSYDLSLDRWTTVRTVVPTDVATSDLDGLLQVVECARQTVLVGKLSGSHRLALWKLGSTTWELMSAYSGYVKRYDCVAAGGQIWFMLGGSHDLLCFEYETQDWRVFPGLPGFQAETILFTQRLLTNCTVTIM